MNCQDNSRLKVPLPEICKTADIGCVPSTSGKPKCPPEPDQIPLAYDKDSRTLWVFDCDSREWIAHTRFSLSELEEVSVDNFKNICEMLKVPVFYNPGNGTVEGHMTIAELGEKIIECSNISTKDSVTVLQQGENVRITSTKSGDTTTYVVSATGGGDEDSKTVIEAGDNITLTSSKSGATTTYKISSTGAGPGDSKTVLTEGTNIKLTKSESGATTTYKIDCTASGADGNDIAVVKAGDNTTVTSSTSGNTTTYTVSATGGGPSDSKTILQGAEGGNVTVTSTTSGATTTYTLNSKDSKSVVKAGTGISVASATSGDTTTYTVSSTVSPGGNPVAITGGTGINVSKTTSSGTDNYTIESTVPTVTVTAGNNVTVDKTTSADGSEVTYKVNSTGGGSGGDGNDITKIVGGDNVTVTSTTSGNTTTYTIGSTGGGPQDSKTVVVGGTGINVTSTTSGATTTYTVINTGGGGGGGTVIFGGSGDSTGKGNVPYHHSIISDAIPISPGHWGSDEDYTFFSRGAAFWDNGGNVVPVSGSNNNPWYLEIECVNPYSSPSTVVIDLNASALFRARGTITSGTAIQPEGSLVDYDVCFIFSLTDELSVNLIDFYYDNTLFNSHPSFTGSHPMFKGTNWGVLRRTYNSGRILNSVTSSYIGTSDIWCDEKVQVARYVGQIPANQTKTVYLQYFLSGVTGGVLPGSGSAEGSGEIDQYLTGGVRQGQWVISAHYNTAIYPS